MTTENKPTKTVFLYEGIVIAAITALSYLLAFSYERGYCNYFSIPHSFISISIKNLLVAGFTLIGFLTPLIIWGGAGIGLIKKPFNDRDIPAGRALIYIVNGFILLTMIVLFKILGFTPTSIKWVIASAIFLNFIMFSFYGIILYKYTLPKSRSFFRYFLLFVKDKSFRKRAFNRIYETERLIDKESISSDTKEKSNGFLNTDFLIEIRKMLPDGFKNYFTFGVIGILLTSPIMFFSGYFDAKNETKFLVPKDYPNYIVLRSYDNAFVAAEFDHSSKSVTNKFILINRDANFYLDLKYVNIGKIKSQTSKISLDFTSIN